ncbi:hypothetical protein N2152v2_001160 [Parachlorella kessleri]
MVVCLGQFGVGCDPGGREYNDDRYSAFSVALKDGRRFSVAGMTCSQAGSLVMSGPTVAQGSTSAPSQPQAVQASHLPELGTDLVAAAQKEKQRVVCLGQFGVGCDPGGREYNDDRYSAFSVALKDGRRFSVAGMTCSQAGSLVMSGPTVAQGSTSAPSQPQAVQASHLPELGTDLVAAAQKEKQRVVCLGQFGVGCDPGGREYNDDRYSAFSVALKDGRRFSVAGVFDGHHKHHVAHLVSDALPTVFAKALKEQQDVVKALSTTVRRLDDLTYELHRQKKLVTGGTTALIHVISADSIFTANVGDCKGVLSVRGAPDALNTCHNPPVPEERERFEAAGVHMYSDHIQDSDINVCRTIGDYDLGQPLKYRDAHGNPAGPLTPDPEIRVHTIDREQDEFLVVATDGLWDYYTPESTVLTDTRRRLRQHNNDPQLAAEWLVQQALSRQRFTLSEATPGDNVTVMIITLRPLPAIPRTSASRLNLRNCASSSDLLGPAGSSTELNRSRNLTADDS